MTATTIMDELKSMLIALDKNIDLIMKRVEHAPPGSLRVSNNGKYRQYYRKIDPVDVFGTYLPRKDRDIAAALAQKDYDSKLLAELVKQQKALERFLKDYDPDAPLDVYEKLSEARKALVTKEFLTDKEYVEQWLNMPYNHMGFGDNDPEYYTPKGERVRSKSELLIADALIRNNIPYRYECPVYEGGYLIGVPDFNCLNVRQRKDYYWEHLGMMSDSTYADKNVRKLEKYSLANDFDESRLILTFETENHPLNTRVIEEKIRRYLK
ncbi:MAG: hypothetical protein K6F03_09120 [Saccharofermentans sp.]|nr:hypothetical protein [Saccharofermentans sp.]